MVDGGTNIALAAKLGCVAWLLSVATFDVLSVVVVLAVGSVVSVVLVAVEVDELTSEVGAVV